MCYALQYRFLKRKSCRSYALLFPNSLESLLLNLLYSSILGLVKMHQSTVHPVCDQLGYSSMVVLRVVPVTVVSSINSRIPVVHMFCICTTFAPL